MLNFFYFECIFNKDHFWWESNNSKVHTNFTQKIIPGMNSKVLYYIDIGFTFHFGIQ
jgi:hypothetical protein